MNLHLRNLGMTTLGFGFLGLARAKNALYGYATPDTVARTDVEGRIAYLIDTFATLRRSLPSGWSPRGLDVLELSPGSSRGNGALFLAAGARSYHAIDAFGLAAGEDPAFYGLLLDRCGPDVHEADVARARALTAAGNGPCFGYAIGRDFDLPRLAGGRSFDLIVSQAAFEHYDDVPDTVRGLTRIARPGCATAHVIDLQTHSRWIRDRDPNNIYRFPAPLYNLFAFPGQPNRWRPADYLRAFEAAGWHEVRFTPCRRIAPALLQASRDGLSAPFNGAGMDMDVLDGILTGRLP